MIATNRRRRVYVSGPLTDGGRLSPDEIVLNMQRAAALGAAVLKAGMAPVIPHLSAAHPCLMEIHWALWMEADLAWLEMADAVLRMPGASQGTNEEVACAREFGIPVFTTLADLIAWRDEVDRQRLPANPLPELE
jgi:hypothetical protein